MSAPRQTSDDTARVLDAAGIEPTEEGRADARAKLAAAKAKMTDAKWQRLRSEMFQYSQPA